MALSRERIALVVFAAVVVLITAGIAFYLFIGHSWNYAATRIDDAAGEMEGYRVIAFEGTAIPSAAQVKEDGERYFSPVSRESVIADYQEKGATVFFIDASDIDNYASPVVFEKDGYRVGVLSVDSGDLTYEIRQKVEQLQERAADIVVVFAQSTKRMETIEGIGAVVRVSDQEDDTELALPVLDMPAVGQVGTIVISPSDVISTRVLPEG